MQRIYGSQTLNRFKKIFLLSMFALFGFGATLLWAQDEEGDASEPTAKQGVSFSGSSGLTGLGSIAPGTWGMIQARVQNTTDADQSARVLFQFTDFPERQFLRTLSLPRKSSRVGEMPVRPGDFSSEAKSIDTEIILLPADRENEMDRVVGTALVTKEQMNFAVISDSESENPNSEIVDDEAIEALTAVRLQQGLGRGTLYLNLRTMPRFDIAWDAAYLAAITVDHPEFDAAQRRAIRRWVSRGGRLVVFLDQVDNEAMAQVVGEAWDIGLVDKVTLTEIQFDPSEAADATQSFDLLQQEDPFEARMETEDPITMARIIAPGWQEHLSVRGWPAVVSKKMGRGELIAITVGGRAWIVPSVKEQEGDKTVLKDVGTEAALIRLTELLIPSSGAGSEPMSPSQAVSGKPGQYYVSQLVGYEVVSRNTVAGVLGGFLLVILLFGVYWNKKGLGERLGVMAVFAAVVATVTLVVVGQQRRTEVEPTAATIQLVELQPGLSAAHVTGVMGLYHPERTQATLQGGSGGWLWPITLTQGSDTQRLTTDDLDRWNWSNVSIAAGSTRPFQVSVDVQTARPTQGSFRFGPEGLAGSMRWPEDTPVEDLLLATPAGNLRVINKPEGDSTQLVIGPQDVLPEGVYFTSGIMTQVQQDRSEMLRQMFKKEDEMARMSVGESAGPVGPVYFDKPTLLGWSRGYDMSIGIEPQLGRNDLALLASPLRVEPSEPGTRVSVPWPLIPMQQVRQSGAAKEQLGLTLMPLYSPQKREWISNQMPSAFIGRFMLPPQVLPLKLTGAKLHLGITAVGRPVRVLAMDGLKLTELQVIQSPDGDQVLELPVEALKVDAEGGVLLAFDVQDESWNDFRALDSDKNDALSAEEFAAGGPDNQAQFSGLDKNQDTNLSLEEFRASRQNSARNSAATKSMSAMWQVHHFGLEVAGEVQPK